MVAVVAAALVLGGDGRQSRLPDPLQAVSPQPGTATLRQAVVEIDLPVGYRIELWVDGRHIPSEVIRLRPGTGLHVWDPTADDTSAVWGAGSHTVVVEWDRVQGLPDAGSFRWSFRVQ